MATPLTPEEIDSLDTALEPSVSSAPASRSLGGKMVLSPQEIDALDTTPKPLAPHEIDAIDVSRGPSIVSRPGPMLPKTGELSTTYGGPPLRAPGPSESIASQAEELPVVGPAISAGRLVGRSIGRGGKLTGAVAKDIASIPSTAAGYTQPWENVKAFVKQPFLPQSTYFKPGEVDESQAPLPYDVRAEQAKGVSRFVMKAAAAPFEMFPQLALSFGLGPAAGVAPGVASAIPMVVTPQGDYDPMGAIIAAGIPGASRLGEKAVSTLLSKIPVAKVAIEVLSQDPLKLKGTVVQKLGGIELSNDIYRKFLEQGGGFVAANAYLLAAKSPEIAALPPEQRKQAILDAVAQNLAPSLLGFLKGGMSESLTELGKGIAPHMEDLRQGVPPIINPDGTPAEPGTAPVISKAPLAIGQELPPEAPPAGAPPRTPQPPATPDQIGQSVWEGATDNGRERLLGNRTGTKKQWAELTSDEQQTVLRNFGYKSPAVAPLTPAEIDQIPTPPIIQKGQQNATTPVAIKGGLPSEPQGTAEIGKTQPEAGAGDLLPSPAGQPPTTVATPQAPAPQAPGPQPEVKPPASSQDFIDMPPERYDAWKKSVVFGPSDLPGVKVSPATVAANWTIQQDLPKLIEQIDLLDDATSETTKRFEELWDKAKKTGNPDDLATAQTASAAHLTLSLKRQTLREFAESIPGVPELIKQHLPAVPKPDQVMDLLRKISKGEIAPKPSVAPTKVSKWKSIGVNHRGEEVFEDQNGVRSYVTGNVRVSEPVRMIPTKEGVETATSGTRGAEFEPVPGDPIRQLIVSSDNAQQKAQAIKKLASERGTGLKEIQEEIEAEIVRLADDIVRNPETTPTQKMSELMALYDTQPVLSARTSASVENQAYSTPAPLAFAISYMAGVTPQTDVYDSTAGNGMLLIGANHGNSAANELNDQRANALRRLLPHSNVTQKDATAYTPPKGTYFSTILLNPPFGSMPNVNYGGYGIKRLEHLIALKALESLMPDGTAAIILGAKREEGETGKGAQWVFENYLYGHFNVLANFEVGGELYAKQGTKWPVRVLVLAGRKATPEMGEFAPKKVERLTTWEQVWTEAQKVRDAVDRTRSTLVPGGKPGLPLRPQGGPSPAPKPGPVSPGAGGAPVPPTVGGVGTGTGAGKQPLVRTPATGAVTKPAGGPSVQPTTGPKPPVRTDVGGKPNAGVEGGGAPGVVPAGNVPETGAGVSPGSEPGGVSRSPAVERAAGDLSNLTDAELDNLLDEAAGKPAPAPPTAAPPPMPSTVPSGKSPSDILSDAAKQGITGIDQAVQGLHDLFGGGGHAGTGGPSFDEETYARAKPHFQSAYEQFKAAGKSLKEFFQFIFKKFSDAIRPYLKRFVKDLQKEEATAPLKLKEPPQIEKTEYQQVYEPRAQGEPFGTLTPKNIAAGEHGALDQLVAKVGPLEEYVANRLNMQVSEVQQVMASEQIDGVAMAIDQIERGDAMILGDQAGIGKGRQAAAIIRYAVLSGKIPLFFTKDPKLFTDMYGDLKDINTTVHPFLLGDTVKATIVDPNGRPIHRAPGRKVQEREMAKILQVGMAEAGYDSIFLTYSQVNMRNTRQQFLEALAANNPTIVILDEAHEAAGDNETSMQAAFISGGQVKRGSGAEQTQIAVPGLLNAAGTKVGQGGVLYLSATYAKRSENMPVYFRTALSKSASKFSSIVSAMQKGGVALQQAVSEALAKSGQYVRRERDFKGVNYNVKRVQVADEAALVEQVDDISSVLSEIVAFSNAARAAAEAGSELGGSTALSENAMDMTDFAAIVHNQVGQMLLAAKAEAVVQEALEAHARGEKPVIALMNTMESFLGQFVEEKGIKPEHEITLRWNELLKYALSRTLRVSEQLPNGDTVVRHISPKDLGLQEQYDSIVEQADNISSKFPVSPIDYIIQKLNAAGVKMVELTGRESGIRYSDFLKGVGVYVHFRKADKNKVVNGFNGGTYDGMLLNASGSTGLSAHASERFKDQRPRHMIVGQPALDINVFMQTLGRIFRTGMVMTGTDLKGQPYGARYTHLILPLQAELRPAAMTAKKMKSLNANTTADTDAAIKIESEDMFNRHGDMIVANYLDQHPDYQMQTGLIIETTESGSVKVPRDIARRFTGRIARMPDEEQKKIYGEILPEYRSYIEQLRAMGDYDLEIVVHDDWDGLQKSDEQLAAGTDESNIFTASVRMQRWEIKDSRHVPTGMEMTKEYEKHLGGRAIALWNKFQERAEQAFDQRRQHLRDQIARLQEDERAAIAEKKPHYAALIAQREQSIATVNEQRERWNTKIVTDITNVLADAGQVLELQNTDTGDIYHGMLVDIKFPSPKGRLAPSSFMFRFMVEAPGGIVYANAEDFMSGKWTKGRSEKEVDDLKGARAGQRYERYFVVGNPIRGYETTGGRGKMVRFRSQEDSIVTGLLMPSNWGPENLANDPRLDLVNGRAVSAFLQNHGTKGYRDYFPVEAGGVVRMVRQPGSTSGYAITTPAAKKTGGAIYLSNDLRRITGDFQKSGNRMVAFVEDKDVARAADVIMQILNTRFRPIGSTEELMPKVLDSNNRGQKGQASLSAGEELPPVETKPPLKIQSTTDLRNALPQSGLSPEQQNLIRAFLDSPLAEKLEGIRYHITDAVERGWQGSYFDKLITLVRNAEPKVGAEEFMHAVWDILPDEIQQEFERMRNVEIDRLLKEAEDEPDRKAILEDLRDNPSTGGHDFIARGIPRDLWADYYRLSSANEYFSQAGSERFQARVGSMQEGFWERVKEFLRDFIAAIKKALKLSMSQEEWLRNILAGRFKTNPGNARATERQASLSREEAITQGEREKWIPTQVLGTKDFVRGREQITPESTANAIAYAQSIFAEAKLPVQPQEAGWFRFVDDGTNRDLEGDKLARLIEREIATKNEPEKHGQLLGSLLNSVVANYKMDNMGMFSRPIREELYDIAQSDRSQRGIALAALAGFKEDLQFVSQNVDVVLHRIYSDTLGGREISSVLRRVLDHFRNWFTDAEIREALASAPELDALVTKLIGLNRQDEGGRVYRRVQALLKPKAAKTLNRLESDARVQEAVDQILENARLLGIEPKKGPKPLSPLRRLMLMVNPETAEKIDNLIAQAVADAERNAGIKATLKAAGSEEERQQLEDSFAAGAQPDPNMVEAGLNMPEFEHWQALRQNLLGYSPTTLKLVQDLIRTDFRGARFKTPEIKPPDTRISIDRLAKEPETEVERVLNAYYDGLEASMDVAGATPETLDRLRRMIEAQVADQLEKARTRFREPMFTEPKKPGEVLTPEQRLALLVNAGLFRDPRLKIPEFVARVAGKPRVTRMTPKLPALVKSALETPFYRQSALKDNFAQELVKRLGISPEQADTAAEVFARAFESRFARAREQALKLAQESLTPKELKLFGQKRPLWKRIERFVNAGGLDTGELLRDIARSKGWVPPTDAQVAHMRDMAAHEQQLRELNPRERLQAGNDPADIAKAQADKEAATLERRVLLKKKMEVMWARMTRPISALHWWETRRNFAAAVNEMTSANLLLRIGFAPRQLLSVLTQGAVHTPTRALATAIERWQNDRTAGRNANLFRDVNQSFADAYKARLAALKAALYSTRAAFVGRGEARNVDRLMSSIAAIERIAAKGDEYAANGDQVRAFITRTFSLIRLGYRVAQALDNLHGVPAEYQEMSAQVVTALREQGKSRAEIEASLDRVMGDMNAEWAAAIETVRRVFETNRDLIVASGGKEPSEREIREAAWNVVKRRQYDRMRELHLPADDFEEVNRLLRNTIGWNERETTGLGGVVASTMSGLTNVLAGAGIPLPLARFGNAIGIMINRHLTFTPFYKFAELGGTGKSPWFNTDRDRLQRQIEAVLGSLIGIPLFMLILMGVLKVILRPPQDPEERALFDAEGHKAGTLEVPLPDGTFIPVSLTVGPLDYVSPYLAAGGAVRDLLDKREKQQAKLNAEALAKGLEPGKIRPITFGDLTGVGAQAAMQSIMSGRTASGLVASFTDYGVPNASKGLASQVSPLTPGLPALQEISRMAGVSLDSKMASFWDFMLPLPTSQAARVNMLGDPVGTESALQRVVQILTGGTYGPVNPAEAHTQEAYAALFETGYRPPSINPAKGYAFGTDYRPMTDAELGRYTALRGQYLKEEIINAGPGADAKMLAAAYQRANARALQEVGVDVAAPSGAGAAGPAQGPAAGAPRLGAAPTAGARLEAAGSAPPVAVIPHAGGTYRAPSPVAAAAGFRRMRSLRSLRRGPSLKPGGPLRALSRGPRNRPSIRRQ